MKEVSQMHKKNKAIKYRIYPSENQEMLFSQTFGCTRFIYNQILELQDDNRKLGNKFISKFDCNAYCTQILKEIFPWLRDVDKFAISNAVFQANTAYVNFFEKRAAHPKFKSKHNHDKSYTTNYTNGNISLVDKGIKIPKAGVVKAKLHRLPPEDWIIKSSTVSMVASGKYYCTILFEYYAEEPVPAIPSEATTLGLDYSSPNFYIDSNGLSPTEEHYYRDAHMKLAKAQRRLSRMKCGSNNYCQQRHKIALIQEKIAFQRKDHCHKLSREIANSYDAVCVEDINLRSMSGGLKLGKATNDNGFGMFRTYLKYKLEEQGKQFVVIDKWYPSTKTCHCCGYVNNELTLKDRSWTCPGCGTHHNRDINAAIVIKEAGLAQYRARSAA